MQAGDSEGVAQMNKHTEGSGRQVSHSQGKELQ